MLSGNIIILILNCYIYMNSQKLSMHSTTIDGIIGQSAWDLQGMGSGTITIKKKEC